MSRTLFALAFLLLVLRFGPGGIGLSAQQRREPATGSVSGRVSCSDTNGPARMASVVLVPIVDTSFLRRPNLKEPEQPHEPDTRVTRTDLNGRFTISRVPVGNYYVVAEKPGYLQPLSLIQREQMNKPDSATASLMARLLTPVTVSANHGSDADVRIYRGATLSGTVTYDDGIPAIGTQLKLQRKDKEGKWTNFSGRRVDEHTARTTDLHGNFLLPGLPAGEYLLSTNLELDEVYVDHLFSDGGGTSSNTLYSLDVYYGDSYRQRDAKVIKVGDGEDVANLNISVRVSEMRSLSGTVTERGGTPVNAATVALLWKDDNTQLVSTEVGEDNSFHFAFVPDGEYTLRVSDARETTRIEVPNCPNCVPPSHTEQKLKREFGGAQQPVILHSDVQGITVTVPPLDTATETRSAR